MKAGELEKRLRWFDRGAAALSQAFPNALADLGPNASPCYACPECAEFEASGKNYRVQLFHRTAVQSFDLTAEHVPPKAFHGRELLLTCRSCNHRAGSQLEAHARKRENFYEVMRGVKTEPARVRVTADRYSFAADLRLDGDTWDLCLPPESRRANDPKEWPAYKDSIRRAAALSPINLPPIKIEFSDAYSPRKANVAWLRHAYLALFAVAGYRYIFHPSLEIVRKQIKEPDIEHISIFLAEVPDEPPWSDRRILLIRKPEIIQSWAVQVGRYIVLLPKAGDVDFYLRVAEDARSLGKRQLKVDEFKWPREPTFGLKGFGALDCGEEMPGAL